MFNKSLRLSLAAAALGVAAMVPAHAAIVVTEVDSVGNNMSYGFDWIELTNRGDSAVSLNGWKVNDESGGLGTARLINGIDSLAPGQSAVVFMEVNGGSAFTTARNRFLTAWFGTTEVPTNFLIGYASGSGLGLGASGDQVHVWNASNVLQTWVRFGSNDTRTFDNAEGISGNEGSLVNFSAIGVNGAFLAAGGEEIGSPGFAPSPVPLPAGAWLLISGMGALGAAARRRRKTAA